MKPIYLIAFVIISLFSCKQEKSIDEGDFAFLGGEIISPINNYVILKRFDQVLDTIELDDKNRFLYKFKNFESDLYTFNLKSSIGNELQFVLLEPNDSIMFRLNTIDFDESLVFTGIGAKKNNYLINMYLEGESNEHKVYKYSKLPTPEFLTRIDSLRSVKQQKLDSFKEKNGFSDSALFSIVAQSNIDYNYYRSKEVYPFVRFGYKHLKKIESLPLDFYAYRSNINYNDDFLKENFSYYNFLKSHINNLALSDYFKQSETCVLGKKSLNYNLVKLNLIDSLVEHPYLKNRLLYFSAGDFLDKNSNPKNCELFLESYLSKSSNEMNKKRITEFASSLKSLKPGAPFPNTKVVDMNGNVIEFNSLVNKPTVVYFWSQAYKWHFKESHDKVKKLKVKYPNIDFIAININEGNVTQCKKVLNQYHFSSDNEYQFTDTNYARKTLALHAINKVILLDKKHTIINSNANMFSKDFEKQLLKFHKK